MLVSFVEFSVSVENGLPTLKSLVHFRHFHLILQKKRGLLARGFRVVAVDKDNKERTVNLDNVNMYHGYLMGKFKV